MCQGAGPTMVSAGVGVGGPSPPTSPVRKIDPVVRALNTVMYGLLVHFGTLWTIELSFSRIEGGDGSCDVNDSEYRAYHPGFLLMVLFLHEYWVYLQHSNVFGNPLLQHLDRQYGIALLRSNRHWSIAGTLSAYWARETLGMFLCLPFLQSSSASPSRGYASFSRTQYMILYSLVYHTIKSRGVRRDALNRSSPKFGIMRLVIDKFYLHTASEVFTSVLRLFLQGFDTYIHYCIVKDLVLISSFAAPSASASHAWFVSSMHILFVVWVVHAALNQLFRCSTASVMVETWHSITAKSPSSPNESKKDLEQTNEQDDGTEGSISSSSDCSFVNSDANDGITESDYVVRQLLHHKRVHDNLKGRQGAASHAVDKAVRLETAISILASLFMLGLGDVPLKALPSMATIDWGSFNWSAFVHDRRRVFSVTFYSWLLWGLLHGIRSMFLKSRQLQRSMKAMQLRHTSRYIHRQRSLIQVFDLALTIGFATQVVPPERKQMMLLICAFLVGKSFLQSMQIEYPKLVWKSVVAVEFASKLVLIRSISDMSADSSLASTVLGAVWAMWVVSSPVPTPCEAGQCNSTQSDVADVVFLGHPALLSDAWALWLIPYSLKERWQAPLWAVPLWPLHYLVGVYVCNYRRKLFGDGASFFCCDDNYYGQTRMQNWVMAHFGRHFVTNPYQVKENIEAAARHAERSGVKVLCLGALNKAESINSGGVGVVKALGPKRKLCVIHGNHLTAAAVVETIHQVFGERKVKLFLTGASSKVGWAVAQALRDRHGYEILCHSTDPGRRRYFQEKGFAAASTLSEGSAFSKYWIVGKYDLEVANIIPQNATAIVFSVPHPLESRRDVRVIEAGTLHMDLSRLDRPRLFTNKLKEQEIFACHAASVVAMHRLEQRSVSRIDEVGPVDPHEMDSWLVDAKKLGFSVPQYDPVTEVSERDLSVDKPPVVIVGSGPSGLSVAACLSQKRIPHVLLEAEEDPNKFGSWQQHFTGLEITTQKKWCNLPGLSMNGKEYPNETVTAEEYQRYLNQYVNRFAIKIKRGVTVTSIKKGSEESPYIVEYKTRASEDKVIQQAAWSVVVATGKHRIPRGDTTDGLVGKLDACGIPHVHSTEMRGDKIWARAIEAAQNGTLCIVGLGNSAADLATMVLQSCQAEKDGKPVIHVAARTIPPVFPRRAKFLRVDTLGFFMRVLPDTAQDFLVKILWWAIPGSRTCNLAFPSHLPRWEKIRGRVPVIDKYGLLAHGFREGRLVGHGPISNVTDEQLVKFSDRPSNGVCGDAAGQGTKIDLVVLATGYRGDCVVDREDRLNGLYKCGFSKSDRFLPLQTISEDARSIADDIASSYS